MKRKIAMVAACLLLLVQTAAFHTAAADTVYFTAVNKDVLELTDATMPFWSGGYLYVPGTIFTTTVGKELNVKYSWNADKQTVVLYTNGTVMQTLIFDLTKEYVVDHEGNVYYQKPIQRGGVIFLPISLIANTFNLSYSTIRVERGYLVWVRNNSMGLSDAEFADAATYRMEYRYAQYIKGEDENVQEEEPEEEPTTETFDGKSVYLCLRAANGETTDSLLDTLDRYNRQAAFYCTGDFLDEQDDLLRRMIASGQAVGLVADGADPTKSVLEQLEAGNRKLFQATCSKTRLAYLENATAQDREAAEQAGYHCLEADLDRSAYGLNSTSTANTLLQRVSARRGDVSVWLGEDVNTAGLQAFLAAAAQADDRCQAITETV